MSGLFVSSSPLSFHLTKLSQLNFCPLSLEFAELCPITLPSALPEVSMAVTFRQHRCMFSTNTDGCTPVSEFTLAVFSYSVYYLFPLSCEKIVPALKYKCVCVYTQKMHTFKNFKKKLLSFP